MKKVLITMILLSMLSFCACDGGTESSSSSSSYESKASVSYKKTTEAQKEMSRSEALDIAQSKIEKNFSTGNHISGDDDEVTSYGLISYGDVTCTYVDGVSNDGYDIVVKGTCWGYDSYGNAVEKYNFEASGSVNVDGYSSQFSIMLS